MKRLVMATSLFILSFGTSAFATDNNYPAFLSTFFKTFSSAEHVSWELVDGFTRVSFQIKGKQNFAYYNEDNALVVVTTPLHVSDLTTSMQSKLRSQYENYTVSAVYECAAGNKKNRYVVLENDKKQLIVTMRGKKWNIYSSSNK